MRASVAVYTKLGLKKRGVAAHCSANFFYGCYWIWDTIGEHEHDDSPATSSGLGSITGKENDDVITKIWAYNYYNYGVLWILIVCLMCFLPGYLGDTIMHHNSKFWDIQKVVRCLIWGYRTIQCFIIILW